MFTDFAFECVVQFLLVTFFWTFRSNLVTFYRDPGSYIPGQSVQTRPAYSSILLTFGMATLHAGERYCRCMECKGTVVQVQATAHYHENKSAYRGIYTDVEQDVDMNNQSGVDLPFTNSDADTMTPSSSDGEIEASEEEEEDESELEGDEPAVEVLAAQVLQMVTDQLITQKGAMAMMKVFRQYLVRTGMDGTEHASSLPMTFYTVKKLAALQVCVVGLRTCLVVFVMDFVLWS